MCVHEAFQFNCRKASNTRRDRAISEDEWIKNATGESEREPSWGKFAYIGAEIYDPQQQKQAAVEFQSLGGCPWKLSGHKLVLRSILAGQKSARTSQLALRVIVVPIAC